jgi:hypothetical protein
MLTHILLDNVWEKKRLCINNPLQKLHVCCSAFFSSLFHSCLILSYLRSISLVNHLKVIAIKNLKSLWNNVKSHIWEHMEFMWKCLMSAWHHMYETHILVMPWIRPSIHYWPQQVAFVRFHFLIALAGSCHIPNIPSLDLVLRQL